MTIKKYNSIDLFKLIMAIFVIAIHTIQIKDITNIVLVQNIYSSIVGCAVPFFFITFGFLMGQHMEEPYSMESNTVIIKSNMLRLIKMYIRLSIIYLPLAVIEYVKENTPLLKSILLYVRGFFFVGEHYNSWPLWFLLSSIYALVLILLLQYFFHCSNKQILFVGTIIFILSIFIDWLVAQETLPSLLAMIKKVFSISIANGRILLGCFYIPLGMFILNSKTETRIPICIIVLVLSFIGTVTIPQASVKSIIAAFLYISLFIVVKEMKLPDNRAYFIMRNMSTFLYNSHMWFWTIIYMAVWKEKTYGLLPFTLTLLCCFAGYFAYHKITARAESK